MTDSPKRGRPKMITDEAQRRRPQVAIPLTDAEKERWDTAARSVGISTTEMVRRLVEYGLPKVEEAAKKVEKLTADVRAVLTGSLDK